MNKDAELFAAAGSLCREVHGEGVLLRGLLEFTNHCRCDCAYCGIRRSNHKVERYRLEEEEILAVTERAFLRGFRTFVLQGGEDPAYPPSRIGRLVERIKERTRGEAAVTLSCGVLSKRQYRDLKKAGADRYLLRFETADPVLYAGLKNGEPLRRRLRALEDLGEAGFQVGTGFMTGLPGETERIREGNLRLAVRLEPDMAGVGPFIPHPDTPLRDAPQESLLHSLRAAAALRLGLPECHIPATTAAGTLDPEGREKMLRAGANVLMPNITPSGYKRHYLLYPGKICLDEEWESCLGCLGVRVRSLGRRLSFERGDAPRLYRKEARHAAS
jgi:biotin synthase